MTGLSRSPIIDLLGVFGLGRPVVADLPCLLDSPGDGLGYSRLLGWYVSPLRGGLGFKPYLLRIEV